MADKYQQEGYMVEPDDFEFSDILLILKVGLVCVVRGGGMEASEVWAGRGKLIRELFIYNRHTMQQQGAERE
jgi:hypothetical protein